MKALALFTSLLLAVAAPAAAQVERPPCSKVMSVVNREVFAREGRSASSRAVAKKMGIERSWVLRCMEAYGRVPSDRAHLSDADREAFERATEEGRPVRIEEDTAELSYEKQEKHRVEKAEQRARQKKLAEQKKFDESADFSFPMNEY